MPAGTSLGEGIGLQTGRNKSDYWIKRLADDNLREQAQKAKYNDDLIKLTDFKIDFGKYYPKWGKAIAEEQRKMYQEIANYRQQNKGVVPYSVAQDMVLRAKERIGSYEMGNERAKQYVEGKEFLKDQNVVNDIISSEGTISDIQKYHNGFDILVGKNGEFSFVPIPSKTIDPKIETNIDYIKKPTGKFEILGNNRWDEVETVLSPNAINREAHQLAKNNDWRLQQLKGGLTRGEIQMVPGESIEQMMIRNMGYFQKKAAEEVVLKAPKGATEYRPSALYHPPQSSESEKRTPIITESSGGIFVDAPKYDSKGEVVPEDNPAQQQIASYDRIISVSDAKPVTVTVTPEIIRLNPQLKGVKSINIKPSTIYRSRDNKGYTLLASGVVQEITDDKGLIVSWNQKAADSKISKSFEPILPYQMVQSEIEKTYPGKMQDIYQQLEIGNKPKNKLAPTSKAPAGYTQVAKNPKTGETIYLVGKKWVKSDGSPYQ